MISDGMTVSTHDSDKSSSHALVGKLILHPHEIDAVSRVIRPHHFKNSGLAWMFSALRRMSRNGMKINAVEFARHNPTGLARVGGPSVLVFVMECASDYGRTANSFALAMQVISEYDQATARLSEDE